jgi:hypothetical protein
VKSWQPPVQLHGHIEPVHSPLAAQRCYRVHRGPFVTMSGKLFDVVFNLKFQAKDLTRNAAKCEKNEKLEKTKAFKAMQKNNMEGAKIHAANAIRLHNENLQFLRIASQCASRPALSAASLCT